MTWIVVVGLMLVMLLWILIYSFFISADFMDKMLISFGSIQFWATVLIIALLALGTYINFSLLNVTAYISLFSASLHH